MWLIGIFLPPARLIQRSWILHDCFYLPCTWVQPYSFGCALYQQRGKSVRLRRESPKQAKPRLKSEQHRRPEIRAREEKEFFQIRNEMQWREVEAGGKIFCSPLQDLGNKTGPGRMYPLKKRSSSTGKEEESVQGGVSDWISPFVGPRLHSFEDFCWFSGRSIAQGWGNV